MVRYYGKSKINSLRGKMITVRIEKRYFTVVEDDFYVWKNLDKIDIKYLFGINLCFVPLNEEFIFIGGPKGKEISYHKYKIIKQKQKRIGG